MLAKIVNQHKPQVLALQETWHLPHNDSMQVEGYPGDEFLDHDSICHDSES
jgi:hypothetical protein